MLRTQTFLENQLFYDTSFAAEDFELWSRVLDYGEINNLPEVLGYYREDGKSITTVKKDQLIIQQGKIVAATLQRNFDIRLSAEQVNYFIGWVNPFFDEQYGIKAENRLSAWEDLRQVLTLIYQRNQERHYYDEKALLQTLAAEWATLRYCTPFELPKKKVSCISQVFAVQSQWQVFLKRASCFCKNYQGFQRKCWKIKTLLDKRRVCREKGE